MKDHYTKADCKEIRDVIVGRVAELFDGKEATVLCSGGVDSLTALFALAEAGIPYKCVNFRFKGVRSVDYESVRMLQAKMGFDCDFVCIEPTIEAVAPFLKKAVVLGERTFGRVREVKTETTFFLLYMKGHCTDAVASGFYSDDLTGYSRKDQIEISKKGEDDPGVLAKRLGEGVPCEFKAVFADRLAYSPFQDRPSAEMIARYETKAIHKGQPKAMLRDIFADYHDRYGSYRKPINLHKGGKANEVFDKIAKDNGYSSALRMFNSLAGR